MVDPVLVAEDPQVGTPGAGVAQAYLDALAAAAPVLSLEQAAQAAEDHRTKHLIQDKAVRTAALLNGESIERPKVMTPVLPVHLDRGQAKGQR